MKNYWIPAFRMFLVLAILTGLIYPLVVTGIAYLTLRQNASGSLIYINGTAVGSSLLAQKFTGERYFWPRPSANDYQGTASGGSNLGPTSGLLKEIIQKRKLELLKASGLGDDAEIPIELLFASGSGLDPHITPQAALFQVDRVVRSRGRNVDAETLRKLIKKHTEKPFLFFIGAYRVNVLKLNIALDRLEEAPQRGF